MRRAVVVIVLVLTLLAGPAAAAPDPTTGDPPARTSPAWREFRSSVEPVTRAELGASWRAGCPVHWSKLRALDVTFWDYAGRHRTGRLIVHAVVVPDVRAVFRRLHTAGFQIKAIRPVTDFGASDARSMRANNTSAFNCRYVAGTTTWSQHSYGRAVDVNPVQNPYVDDGVADPTNGTPWIDRSPAGPGMAVAGNVLVRAFADIGWGWGGRWTSARDYQHFSQSGR